MINIKASEKIPVYSSNKKYYRSRYVTNDGLNMNIMNYYLKGSGYRVKHISKSLGGISATPYQLLPVNKNFKGLKKKGVFPTLTIKQYCLTSNGNIEWWNKEINKRLKHAKNINKKDR